MAGFISTSGVEELDPGSIAVLGAAGVPSCRFGAPGMGGSLAGVGGQGVALPGPAQTLGLKPRNKNIVSHVIAISV